MLGLGKKKTPDPGRRQQGGVSSNPPERKVFSYYNNRPRGAEDTRRNSKQKKANHRQLTNQQWFRNLPALLALMAVILSFLYCLGLKTTPHVVIAPPTDSKAVPPLRSLQAYQEGAQDILDNSPLNRTKLTINTKSFKKQFLQRFPEVEDVSISLPLVSQQPVITLLEAEPALMLQAHDKLVVLSTDGRVIMPAAALLEGVRSKLITVTDQSGLPVELGNSVLSSTDVHYITVVTRQLNARGLKVQSMNLPPHSQEIDVRIVGLPYTVKFDLSTHPEQGVGAYLALKQSLDTNKVTPNSYVDVRIEGRAYYK